MPDDARSRHALPTANRVGLRLVSGVRRLGREVWWWVSRAAALWRGHRLSSTLHPLLTVLVWVQDWQLLIGVLLAPVIGISLWARLGPVSYQDRVRGPLHRRRVRRWLRGSWPAVMESVGLGRRTPTPPRSTPGGSRGQRVAQLQVPGLRRLQWRDGQLVAWPQLLTGQTIEDVQLVAECSGWRWTHTGAGSCRTPP
jgi:S-DNA-T family DNA segregation ATPase FtsK/SpoIIIE